MNETCKWVDDCGLDYCVNGIDCPEYVHEDSPDD